MKKTKPTEYMYASSRLHALERYMVGRDRMEALMECRSVDDAVARLAEYGLTLPEGSDGITPAAWEEMLLAALRRAYDEAESSAPDPAPLRAFRYPYDCNNLKVALKCAVRGLSPEGLFYDFGTIPAADVETILREGTAGKFYPPAMADGVNAARAAYAATTDPRTIDAILDKACYTDMLATLSRLGDDTVTGWLRAKIDLLNITICLRILRMNRGVSGAEFLADTLLAGGTLPASFFTEAYAGGDTALWAALIPTSYAKLARLGDEPALSLVEKTADDLWMETVRADAHIPFGAPVVAGYLVGWEVSVKNIRILLAAKAAGLSQETLRERMRASYV